MKHLSLLFLDPLLNVATVPVECAYWVALSPFALMAYAFTP